MKSYSDNYVNIIIAHICTQVFDFKLCDKDMKVIESFNRNERFIVPTIMVSIKYAVSMLLFWNICCDLNFFLLHRKMDKKSGEMQSTLISLSMIHFDKIQQCVNFFDIEDMATSILS